MFRQVLETASFGVFVKFRLFFFFFFESPIPDQTLGACSRVLQGRYGSTFSWSEFSFQD